MRRKVKTDFSPRFLSPVSTQKPMNITFGSSVIICNDLNTMKDFYQEVLQQIVDFDFGNCISYKSRISLWQLKEHYPISEKLGYTYSTQGNQNLELSFETDEYEQLLTHLKQYDLKYLHHTEEESWGQKTLRLFDPEHNLIEIGESIPCFVKRLYNSGKNIAEVAARTSISEAVVRQICM